MHRRRGRDLRADNIYSARLLTLRRANEDVLLNLQQHSFCFALFTEFRWILRLLWWYFSVLPTLTKTAVKTK